MGKNANQQTQNLSHEKINEHKMKDRNLWKEQQNNQKENWIKKKYRKINVKDNINVKVNVPQAT